MKYYPPESTWIGILGGGQLGRMLTIVARRMGYKVVTWTGSDPQSDAGPALLADELIHAPFGCGESRDRFLKRADVVTVEFENIPAELLLAVEKVLPMSPGAQPVITCQHREREKRFLAESGIPCAPFSVIGNEEELRESLSKLPENGGILKTAEFGYDGKGQLPVMASDDPARIWSEFEGKRAVLEHKIDLASELSVLVGRDYEGRCVTYDPAENTHRHHILDLSIVPARQPESILTEARDISLRIVEALDYQGIMAVEFFVSSQGELLVNEMAPRPHNSGHHTIDACHCSQFEQQLRVMCGMPLGSPHQHSPVVLWNILGDIWPEGGDGCPDWERILQPEGSALHLYGKEEARPGRKMGHAIYRAESLAEALVQAQAVRSVFYGET